MERRFGLDGEAGVLSSFGGWWGRLMPCVVSRLCMLLECSIWLVASTWGEIEYEMGTGMFKTKSSQHVFFSCSVQSQ